MAASGSPRKQQHAHGWSPIPHESEHQWHKHFDIDQIFISNLPTKGTWCPAAAASCRSCDGGWYYNRKLLLRILHRRAQHLPSLFSFSFFVVAPALFLFCHLIVLVPHSSCSCIEMSLAYIGQHRRALACASKPPTYPTTS